MTRLFIAEKPDMGRKIASALALPHKNGQGYIETGEGIVTWCIGHIMESFEPPDYDPNWKKWDFSVLPMIPPTWKIKVTDAKKTQFNVIKNLVKNASEIVNAGDPGREGQLIVDEVLQYLNNKKPVLRILLDALDKPSIRKALNNLEDNANFYNLFLAAECRGYADWLIGMNGTRAYTLVAQKNHYEGVLSVGRVQSPTLAIVVKRDEEIENFVSHTYYTINAKFSSTKHFNTTWRPNELTPLTSLDKEKRLIDNQLADNIIKKIQGKNGIVTDYSEVEGKSNQPLPFNLSKLQIYANAKWGTSAKDVLDTCQSLYQNHELTSYPRTDCQYLKESHHADGAIITSNIGQSFPNLAQAAGAVTLSIKSAAWNDKKLSDHYAIIPTQKVADITKLSPLELKIYQAICERYLAQFYPPCEFLTTTIVIDCEKETFKTTGKVITKPGWKAIFDSGEEEEDDNENSQTLPALKIGDTVQFVSAIKNTKQTTPPARFTEGTLLDAMTNVHTLVDDPVHKAKLKDKKGIGQEATRTGILETLFRRNFLKKDEKKLISTEAARTLVHNLPKKIIDPTLTAIWEDALDKIAEGKISATDFKSKQQAWVQQLVTDAQTLSIKITSTAPPKNAYTKTASKPASKSAASKPASTAPKTKSSGKKCPACGQGELVEKKAKASGKIFLGCNTWPKCNHVEWPKK